MILECDAIGGLMKESLVTIVNRVTQLVIADTDVVDGFVRLQS